MSIGLALVLIAILYLIDKHNLWKHAPRLVKKVLIVCGVLALGVGMVWGIIVGWSKYRDYRDGKVAEAEAAKFDAKVKACAERPLPAGTTTVDCSNPDNPIYSTGPDYDALAKQFGGTTTPLQSVVKQPTQRLEEARHKAEQDKAQQLAARQKDCDDAAAKSFRYLQQNRPDSRTL